MTPEQIQELIDTLLNMGETMATEAFRFAMRQTIIQAGGEVIWIVLFIIAIMLSPRVISSGQAMRKESEYTYWEIAFYGGWGMRIGGAILIPISLQYIILRLLNPEWYAIKLVLDLIK